MNSISKSALAQQIHVSLKGHSRLNFVSMCTKHAIILYS